MIEKPLAFRRPFSRAYRIYMRKAAKKERTKTDVNTIITWLTGYKNAQIQQLLKTNISTEKFFRQAPKINANAERISGIVNGIHVEYMSNLLMRRIRCLDKLVDELTQGKEMSLILRQ